MTRLWEFPTHLFHRRQKHLQSSAAVSSCVLSAPKVAKESYVQSCKSHQATRIFNKLLASSTLWAGRSARVQRNNSTPTSKFSGLVTSHPWWWLWSCRILHLFPSRFFFVECAASEILKRQARPCPPAVLAGCGYYVGHPAKRFDALCQFQVRIFHDFSICHQHVVFNLFPVSPFNLQTEHIQKNNEDFTTTQYLLF